ncbi:DUF2232 domain-containing protein [Bradyrhizobium sp. Pear76]|uniref:DUF2232 domain-containing protein n=1 Tax=Bradyrhizobium oropedii TaxID=1571201 RepID=UPI001E610B70|nr:DUF2232 domain-containing protein [Bradyrhizobium oropedii]MCC8967619.1 DUF2232 domain-containing protein [Bradyrhizobium oropedii]
MIAILIVALAAGAASALMFASIFSGAAISLPLVYLAPLPLMVVGLGWGPVAAVVGGIAATGAMAIVLGWSHSIGFGLAVFLPAVWLGHLALLGRPVVAAAHVGNPTDLEWYPVDRILLWIVVIAVLLATAILLVFGTDAQSVAETVRQLLREATRGTDGNLTAEQIDQFAKLFAFLAPVALPVNVILWLTLNLWLAAKVARTSGRFHRPSPDLRSVALPPITLVIMATAIAFCFVGGTVAMIATVIAMALLLAYAIVGFAVLHVLTLSASNRAFWLACTYVLMFLFSGLILVMTALGIADAVFGLRQRYLQTRPPPLPAA